MDIRGLHPHICQDSEEAVQTSILAKIAFWSLEATNERGP